MASSRALSPPALLLATTCVLAAACGPSVAGVGTERSQATFAEAPESIPSPVVPLDAVSTSAAGSPDAPGDAEAILERAVALASAADSYTIDSEIRVEASALSTDAGALDTWIRRSVVLDQADGAMRVSSSSPLSANGAGAPTTNEIYAFADYAYLRTAMPGRDAVWEKTRVTPDLTNSPILTQFRDLPVGWVNPDDIAYVRGDTLDAIACHVLRIVANSDQRLSYAAAGLGHPPFPLQSAGISDGYATVPVADSIVWIDAASGYLLRAESEVVVDGSRLGELSTFGTVPSSRTTRVDRFAGYNSAPPVALPIEAGAATEVSAEEFLRAR
jgi:hypothetical protein